VSDDEGSGSLPPPMPPVKKKSRKPDQPFLLVVSFPSPHGPGQLRYKGGVTASGNRNGVEFVYVFLAEDSAPQYSGLFLNETPHHTPAYDFSPNSDKQWILQVTPKMNSNLKDYTNLLMTKRLQTLQSVDNSVRNIMETLKSSGFADDTYVFYTSDHGYFTECSCFNNIKLNYTFMNKMKLLLNSYHVGQFGLIKGKAMPYEFDIRVPFFVKTPNNLIPKGTMILEPVLNIDLAPTFLQLVREFYK